VTLRGGGPPRDSGLYQLLPPPFFCDWFKSACFLRISRYQFQQNLSVLTSFSSTRPRPCSLAAPDRPQVKLSISDSLFFVVGSLISAFRTPVVEPPPFPSKSRRPLSSALGACFFSVLVQRRVSFFTTSTTFFVPLLLPKSIGVPFWSASPEKPLATCPFGAEAGFFWKALGISTLFFQLRWSPPSSSFFSDAIAIVFFSHADDRAGISLTPSFV